MKYEIKFTNDKELITRYKQLRKELYRVDPKFVGFREFTYTGAEDYGDTDNQMLIIFDSNDVYGGVSLRISTPQNPVILNLEKDILPSKGELYFSLKEKLPELKLSECAYAEFDNLVLHQSLRSGEYIKLAFQALLTYCIDYRVRYMFGMGDKARVRLYRQIGYQLNVDGRIHNAIDIPMRPEYENKKMYILYGDIKNFHTVLSDSDATSLLIPHDKVI